MIGYMGPINTATLENDCFRQVLFTGKHIQLVVMCMQPREETGKEFHPNVDQFFRIEQGEAAFVFSETEEYLVGVGDAVVVPAGTNYNILNTSETTLLRFSTIYTRPNNADGSGRRTKTEAEGAEAA